VRTNFNAVLTNYSLATTYWPAFKRSVVDGGAAGIMCSYNAINGVPACASPLLSNVLRTTWGFNGYMTSDSGAVECIYSGHHYVPFANQTACAALPFTDVCSGPAYHNDVMSCPTDTIKQALANTLRIRLRLGLFDPVDDQPYWHVPIEAVDTQASRDLNLLAAQEGLVLLKNDDTLPLPRGRRLAVVGPHANATLALVGNVRLPLTALRPPAPASVTPNNPNPTSRPTIPLTNSISARYARLTSLSALSRRTSRSPRPTWAARPRSPRSTRW
jgi:beta-glucosidase-like glycosyl hydrolase